MNAPLARPAPQDRPRVEISGGPMDGRVIEFAPGTLYREVLLFTVELRQPPEWLRGPFSESSHHARLGQAIARFDRIRPDGVAVYRWEGVREG